MPIQPLPMLTETDLDTKSRSKKKEDDGNNIELIYNWLQDFIDDFVSLVEEIVDGTIGSGSSSGVSSDHLHGLTSLHADGSSATIQLVDIIEYIESVSVDGVEIYPGFYTLSNGRSSVLLDVIPTAGQFVTIHYVISRL